MRRLALLLATVAFAVGIAGPVWAQCTTTDESRELSLGFPLRAGEGDASAAAVTGNPVRRQWYP